MTNEDFRISLEKWACTGCQQLLDSVPEGSGICRVVSVPSDKYSVAYVSRRGGSYKQEGNPGNWYASSFALAYTEAKATGKSICEYSVLNQQTPVLNCHNLPSDLNKAIYEDGEQQTGSYDKSLIVLDVASRHLANASYSGVYFPTRRAEGGILVFDRNAVAVTTIHTGEYPPGPDCIINISGK